ncbi:YkgJ family cysteine cluster protein [Aquimarina algicola]|uniref:YkgJ family cysteine cluster protein n=1 Tax=Aquimarina algicola TaxID=2589995 RepID=A0A504J3T1_9FLAO|nr:YkgJ family cysteine cluster protein [Aquimarina algicola]TPN81749.1 YkgJ family cysteine cluster protein [Aquimarina algicola]
MQELINQLPTLAKDKYKENKKYFAKLKKKPPKKLDQMMQELHDEEFAATDCLSCANCCKTTGPLFTDKDVERIAKFFKMKPRQFEEQYLRTDEEGDLILKKTPCTFLGADNYCSIYEVRPKACREYPHTDRKKFQQISNLTIKNVAICPAAFNIVEKMKAKLPL